MRTQDAISQLSGVEDRGKALAAMCFAGSLLSLSHLAGNDVAPILRDFRRYIDPLPQTTILDEPGLEHLSLRASQLIDAAEEEPSGTEFYGFGALVVLHYALMVILQGPVDTYLDWCLGHGAGILGFLDEEFPGMESVAAFERSLDRLVAAFHSSSSESQLVESIWEAFEELRMELVKVS